MTSDTSTLSYVDTHCHLDLYSDPAIVVRQAEDAGVRIVAVTNTPSVFVGTKELAERSRWVIPALGLHPELAREREGELGLFRSLLPSVRVVGEIGLDGRDRDVSDQAAQRRVFEGILAECRRSEGKVLSVHSRRMAADTIRAIGESFPGRIILHWFSGSVPEAEIALSYGFYFSINLSMCRSGSGKQLLRAIPQDRILTESDGPLAKVAGSAGSPTDIPLLVGEIASHWRVLPAEAAREVMRNFQIATGSDDE